MARDRTSRRRTVCTSQTNERGNGDRTKISMSGGEASEVRPHTIHSVLNMLSIQFDWFVHGSYSFAVLATEWLCDACKLMKCVFSCSLFCLRAFRTHIDSVIVARINQISAVFAIDNFVAIAAFVLNQCKGESKESHQIFVRFPRGNMNRSTL